MKNEKDELNNETQNLPQAMELLKTTISAS